jgi:hypothetical protein
VPTSEYWQIPHVLEVLAFVRPTTLLDVGAGFGKYGCLAREYADVRRVDALDVQPPKLPCYDHIYLGDVRQLARVLPVDVPSYDLALLSDVIEHLEKGEGHALLERLLERAKRVLLTTPLGFRRQEIPGQPYETHRSGWYPWSFSRRYRVHRMSVFPGQYSRRIGRPRLFQLLALIGRKDSI